MVLPQPLEFLLSLWYTLTKFISSSKKEANITQEYFIKELLAELDVPKPTAGTLSRHAREGSFNARKVGAEARGTWAISCDDDFKRWFASWQAKVNLSKKRKKLIRGFLAKHPEWSDEKIADAIRSVETLGSISGQQVWRIRRLGPLDIDISEITETPKFKEWLTEWEAKARLASKRLELIKKLHRQHPEWSHQKMANEITELDVIGSVSHMTVRRIRKELE